MLVGGLASAAVIIGLALVLAWKNRRRNADGSPTQQPDQTQVQSPEVIEPLPEMEAIDFDLGAPSPEQFATTEVNPQLPATDTLVMGSTSAESDFSETYIGFEPTMVQQGELVQPEAGLIDFQLDTGVPIANGILTCETDGQAEVRMQPKGADCAQAAVEMANLQKALLQ